jgi:hypothetical protein
LQQENDYTNEDYARIEPKINADENEIILLSPTLATGEAEGLVKIDNLIKPKVTN